MTAIIFAGIALLAATQSATIDVGEERIITVAGLDAPVIEPHLSINPKNPNNLIAAAMVARPDRSYGVIGLSSRDGGRTWSEKPVTVARGQDHPTLLVDPDGGLYTVSAGYERGRSGKTRATVVVARSTDGGATFAKPVGVVAIAWYDARSDRSTIKGNFRCQEIFFTASTDGGVTFLPEVKVSTKPSCPATPRNVETALRFPAGGEYMGLAAAPDGSYRLLWSDSRSEIYRLYTATVSVRGGVRLADSSSNRIRTK